MVDRGRWSSRIASTLAAGALLGPGLARAQAGGGGGGPSPWLGQIFLFGSIMLIFYFLILRPQQKRQRALQKMIEGLRKGDRVVTSGGMYGTVFAIKDDTVVLEIGKEVRVEFAKSAITAVVPA